MDILHRNILKDMRIKIVDDLDVENGAIEALKTKNVLKLEQIERILQVSLKTERAELLLDILPRCGRTAFDTFRDSLAHHYWWLHDGISNLSNTRSQDTTNFIRNKPERPNLPYPSPPVFREKQVGEMKSALENLTPGGYLVLHGMKGFGKSSLTTSTLTDEELTIRLFNNQIYWIKFGNKRWIEDEISIQLNCLYHQVVGSSDNIKSSLNFASLKQHLQNCLRTHFHKNKLCNALLVLDDVWSNDIIEAFDLPCKTLVITADLHILEDKQHQTIELKDGFTEQESLGLFAESLQIDVNKLPPEAKRIHEECYGMPMLISMLAAEFKKFADLEYNTNRWISYLEALRTNDPNGILGKVRAKQEAIFEMCIDRLEPDAKSRYEKLVIFNEEVNITSQTLQILWEEQSPCQADQHMLYFCEKSLAARHHNRLLKSYVYGVHDLLLCYLRKKITPEQLRELHRSFIKKYREYCQGDFSKLPNDNYSFSYIGHHLEQSEMSEEFKKMYLNFDFLTAKINHSGLSDLLIDLKKYKRLITNDDKEVEAKLADLEEFLKREAGTIVNHKRRRCLDLVQIGLTCSESGFVAQSVKQIADERSSNLYVTYDKRYGSYEVPESLDIMSDTEKAVFLNHPDEILMGNSMGEVMLWNCETREHSFFADNRQNETNRTNCSIQKIIVSSNGTFFLTLCNSGQVNLFNVRNEDRISNGSSRSGQTPREKQSFWIPLHGDKVCKDSSELPISVTGETITDVALSDDKRIGICTSSGTIEVWSIDGERIFSKKIMKQVDKVIYENFRWVAFTEKSAMLQVMNYDGVIRFYTEKRDKLITSEQYCEIFMYHPDFKEQSVILFQPRPATDRCLVIVTEKRPYYLSWLELPEKNDLSRVQGIITPTLREGTEINSVTSYFTCAALTADGKYLVTGHSKSLVTVWNMDEASDPIADFSGHVTSLDTFWLYEGCHLICGSGDKVIHRWPLENSIVRTFLFDAAMKPWGEDDIVAKESLENSIEIYRGNSMMVKTEPIVGTLTDLAINSDGNKVVYASRVQETDKLPQWKVTVFDIELKKSTAISNLSTRPTILRFLTIDECTGIVYTEKEDLRIWYGTRPRSSASVKNVINIHVVNDSEVLTITPHDVRLFRITNMNWHLIHMVEGYYIANDKMICSSIAPNVMALAVLTANGLMINYVIEKDDSVIPTDIKIWCEEPTSFQQKIICCKYSLDSKFLALGLDDGSVLVLDAITRIKVCQLDFHCHEVNDLCFWPSSIGVPILLSANRDEFAWSKLGPVLNEKQKNQRNRKRPYRSAQTTTPEAQGTSQYSLDEQNQISDLQKNNNAVTTYWERKTARYSSRNDLLSVVPLPPTHKMKLCVSDDCTKLLFVDTHGFICNLKFLNYPEMSFFRSSYTKRTIL